MKFMPVWRWWPIVVLLMISCVGARAASAADESLSSFTVLAGAEDESWTILRTEPGGEIVLLLIKADSSNGAGIMNPEADPPEPIPYRNAQLRAAQQAIIVQDLETRMLIEVRRLTGNSTITIDDPSITPGKLRRAQRRATDAFVFDHAGVPLFAAMGLRSPSLLFTEKLPGREQLVSRNLVVNSNIGPLNLDWLTTLGLKFLAARHPEPLYTDVLLTYLVGKTYWNNRKKYEATILPVQDINAIMAVTMLARGRGRFGLQHFLDPAKAKELKDHLQAIRAPWEPVVDVLTEAEVRESDRHTDPLRNSDHLQYDNKYTLAARIAEDFAAKIGQPVSLLADAGSRDVSTRLREELGLRATRIDQATADALQQNIAAVTPVAASGPRLPSFWTSVGDGKDYGQTQTEAGVLPGLVRKSVKTIAVFGSDPATDLIVKGIAHRFGNTVKVLRYPDDPTDQEQQRRARAQGADAILGVRPRQGLLGTPDVAHDSSDDCLSTDDCDDGPVTSRIAAHCFGPECNGSAGGGTGGGGGDCKGPECGPGGVLVDPRPRLAPGGAGGLAAQIRNRCDFTTTSACDLK